MAYTVMALLLLVTGVVVMLYSPWAQDNLRIALLRKMNSGDTELRLDSFRLRFPLTVEASGVAMISHGDTLMAASSLSADVALLPLFTGRVRVGEVLAENAAYRMGAPDSALYMVIDARRIALDGVGVCLSDMSIRLDDGLISGGRLAMLMNPDTTPPTPPAPPTKMSIDLGRVRLDDFTYSMRMLPTIDTLSAHIRSSELKGGNIDLYKQTIGLGTFAGRGLSARYIAPDSATIAAGGPYPVAAPVPDSLASAPWTIRIDSISFTHSDALYTTAGVRPLPGLDFAYIAVDSLDLDVHDFYNRATTLSLPLSLRGRERCGVTLAIDGELGIDSVALSFKNINLNTPRGTAVAAEGILGMGDMAGDPSLPLGLQLDGSFAGADLADMFPAFSPYLAAIPRHEPLRLEVDATGTTGRLEIATLGLDLNHSVSLDAKGVVENFMAPDRLAGDITLSGRIIDVNSFKNAFLDPATAKTLRVPPMTVNGHVAMRGGVVNGNMRAATKGGRVGLAGRWYGKGETYSGTLDLSTFPIDAFMPLLGVGSVTAKASVQGKGYSPFKKSTAIKAHADIAKAEYGGVAYTDISADANLADGMADVEVISQSDAADFTLTANGNLDGDTYTWHADLDGRYIDLYALKLMAEPSSLEVSMNGEATIGPGKNDINGKVLIGDVYYRTVKGTIGLSDIEAVLTANDSLTSASLHNRDLAVNFNSPVGLDSLTTGFGNVGAILAEQVKLMSINVDTVDRAMPPFDLVIHGARSNLVNDILAPSKMSVRSFDLHAFKDSVFVAGGKIMRFDTGSMTLDSIYVGARQHDGHFHIGAGVRNRPGNLDEWHSVTLTGTVDGNALALRLRQKNLKGKTGFDIGIAAEAEAADTTIVLHVKPFDPVIGYKDWTVNPDNFISYTIPSQHVDANLHMEGGNSSLAVYTEEGDAHDAHGHEQEDLVIKLGNIHLQDWIAVNPFAPPVKGDVSADMRLNRHDGMLVGNGSASIANFLYGKEKVADFKADFNVAATPSGMVHAKADVFVNGMKTMTLAGALNDSTATSPLDLDFSVIHFPLATANPFLPSSVGKLSGMLNGNLRITGTDAKPIFNGTLDFDSTAVRLAMTGTAYRFSETPVQVVDNLVSFDDFSIYGCNDNPLSVNGRVDISDMADMKLNLSLKADNMMIVDSKRASKGADIYGKGYISLNANAHGSMRFMQINADLSVNSGTNITYVIPEATNTLANRSNEDMVKFVNFTDSAEVARADSINPTGMAMMLDAVLTIEQGSTVNVLLSADGANRIQLQSNGTLTYSMSPLDDGRLTGRLNIDKGFVRYTPPLMSEKLFNFDDNSYIAFTGDMMNPTLNVHAVDVLRANVTSEGQNSRLVNFDVLLSVTGTLNRMNVAFDLATNDDMTVANELESMSAEQRANQAMNMLLYNVYTGPGTKGNASLSGNPLFSYLESQVNNWAANNIKGVDLSFGIDQYNRTVDGSTSSTMSYSYQVSKALFNDRFKIVVGGNYNTDANADENFSQNLINDISFEYFLNKTRTMYLRLFRHTGYESILEGEITQTGVGFVYRRKLRRIGDMFLPEGLVKRRLEKQQNKESETTETEEK